LLLEQHELHLVVLQRMVALLRNAWRVGGHVAGPRAVASEGEVLTVKAGLGHWGALDARAHTLGGGSVTHCHSVLMGQTLGIYLDVLLLRTWALRHEFIELVVGHVSSIHTTCGPVLISLYSPHGYDR
jgi:hypothetical protein